MESRIQEILYQHLVNQEEERSITTDKCVKNDIDSEKSDEAILDTRKRLDVKLGKGKCSQLIIEQIARHRLNIGEKFNNKIEFYNASELIDLIELLENDKIEYTDFTGPILNGFSKIHHGTYSGLGYSLVRNIKEFWFKKGKIRDNKQIHFKEIVAKYEDYGIASVANAMHTYALKNKNLKSEWIIFKQMNEKKFYLCLASHNEKDELIFENKIKRCLIQYPELTKK